MHAGLRARISASVSKVIHKDKIAADGKIVLGLSDAQETDLINMVRQRKMFLKCIEISQRMVT